MRQARFSLQTIAKLQEKQYFYFKSLQNLRETNIFITNHEKVKKKQSFSLTLFVYLCQTLGKFIFSLKIT